MQPKLHKPHKQTWTNQTIDTCRSIRCLKSKNHITNTLILIRLIIVTKMRAALLIFVLISIHNSLAKIDLKHLKCLVCEKTIYEIENLVSTIDPSIKVDVGGYRLDAKGDYKKTQVSQRRSEVHLSDAFEKVCERLDDYVKATWKTNGTLTLVKLTGEGNQMNMALSEVDFVQDGDLNKSLKYYCEGLLEEHEDAILKSFIDDEDDIELRICTKEAKFCKPKSAEKKEL